MSEIAQAPLSPCRECPWLRSNSGRTAPPPYEDSYSRDHHVRCWRDVVSGQLSVCHLTADHEAFPMGTDPRWIEGGYQQVPDNARSHECAGSVVAALREVRRIIAAGSMEAYRSANPQGMTAATATKWLRRLRGLPVDKWPALREPTVDERLITDPAREYDIDLLELMPPRQAESFLEALDGILAPARSEVVADD